MSSLGDGEMVSVSVVLANQVLNALSSASLRRRVAQAAGVADGVLEERDARIPHETHLALWRAAAQASGDAQFGLRVARSLKPAVYGALGYAIASSATVADAWQRLRTHSALLYDELALSHELRGDHIVLRYSLPGDAAPAELFEAVMASFIFTVRDLTRGCFEVERVRFRHRLRDARLARELGVEIDYRRDENAIVAEASSLTLPIASAEPGLAGVLEDYLADLKARLPKAQDFISQVRTVLLSALPDLPTASQTARRMALGERTLQRRLNSEGTTFRELVDRTRHQVALEHLSRTELTIGEIAFTLGFADDRAFNKAFRRWAGCTPAEQRRVIAARLPTPSGR